MSFLISYLKQRHRGILLFAFFVAVFAVSFWLYELPMNAVIYPALLCLFFGLIFLFFDLKKLYAKHKMLVSLQTLSAELMTDLPAGDTVEDEDYGEIIRLLQNELKNLETKMDIRFDETVEYYTVWAHQIKTPIASMSLKLQNNDTELSRSIAEDLQRIEQYVEMVLAFLRLDSDYSDYVIKKSNLDSIVKGSVKKFANQFIRRKIKLDYRLDDALVLTDEKWLSFVIEQVLSNALKYTLSGTVSVYLESPKTLCIRDTGIGIAPEDIPRIFEKGYTGGNGRRDKKASGIGLYLCRRICKNLGHTITVESEADKGTVVKIGLESAKLEIE